MENRMEEDLDMERHIFISYCHAEDKVIRDTVIDLASQYRTWIDKDGLTLGQDFDEEIKQNILNSACVVVFLSIHYSDSDYCLRELEWAESNDKFIMPIMMDEEADIRKRRHGNRMLDICMKRHMFLSYVSLPSTDIRKVIPEIIDSIEKNNFDVVKEDCVKGKPEEFFPPYIPPFDVSTPSKFRFAYNYKVDELKLIGREEELERLERFVNAEPLQSWCLVTGAGGTGKSRLCFEFARQMNQKAWDVRYLDHNVANELEKLKVRPCNDMLVVVDYAISHSKAVADYLYHLSTSRETRFKTKVILIDRDLKHNSRNPGDLDDSFKQVFPFLENSEHTSEIKKIQYGGLPYIQTDRPDKDMLAGMMQQYAKVELNRDMAESTANGLCESLEQIDPKCERPLYALFISDAWASGNKLFKTTEEALQYVLDRELDELVSKSGIKTREDNQNIDYFKQALMGIMSIATFNNNIPFDTLKKEARDYCTHLEQHLDYPFGSKLKQYFKEIGWMMVDANGNAVVSAFRPDMIGEYIVLQYMKDTDNTEWLFKGQWYKNEGVLQFIGNLAKDFPTELGKNNVFWNNLLNSTVENEHVMGYSGLLNGIYVITASQRKRNILGRMLKLVEQAATPEDEDKLHEMVARAYYESGDYEESLSHYRRNIMYRKRVLGKDHPSTVASYNNIGGVYDSMGDYGKALEYYKKALAIKERTLGRDHPSTATSYNNIGGVYDSMGDYGKALECHKKALAIREGTLGSDHPSTATSYNNIGLVYKSMGDYGKALDYYDKALAIHEGTLGSDHPSTATSYNNIGLVYDSMGDYGKALEYYKKALAIREGTLGSDHPSTATSYNNIAVLYYNSGDYKQSLNYFYKTLEILEPILGKEHPNAKASSEGMLAAMSKYLNSGGNLDDFEFPVVMKFIELIASLQG